MTRQLTTDVLADQYIAGAMTPQIPLPFKDLLVRAQEMLNLLAKSLFFRRFVAEKIAELGEGRDFIRIARDGRSESSEWLVLTADYQLKFWIFGSGSLYDVDEISHSTFLTAKAGDRLSQMQSAMDAMRYLMTRFGAPSFTVTDIEQEAVRNGTIRITLINQTGGAGDDSTSITDMIKYRLEQLQFQVEVKIVDYAAVDLETTVVDDDGQDLFVMNLLPLARPQAMALYAKLTARVKQRLWVGAFPNYESYGYSREILAHPWYQPTCELPNDQLLALLDGMFAN